MLKTFDLPILFPEIFPEIMPGNKLTYKVRIRKDWLRKDGTCSLYLSLQQNGVYKKISLDLYVAPKMFDSKKQRVKPTCPNYYDINLLLEKKLADINKIEVAYRLNGQLLTIDKLLEEMSSPGLRINFLQFYKTVVKYQAENNFIKHSTYKQQMVTYRKLKDYKNPIMFQDITEEFLSNWKKFLEVEKNNAPATVQIAVKNFKKYIHIANKKGIETPLFFTDIKVKNVKGNITFLMPKELKKLYQFYKGGFASQEWLDILQRYLFSCFTGLRISDIENLTHANFNGDILVFNAQKTGELQRIRLNQTAMELIELPQVFNGVYSQQHINRQLKEIAKAVNIKKRLYFHSARHTFATNYLIAGGQLVNLQKLLGHSKIDTTMVYSHTVDSVLDQEIGLMDSIID